MSWSECDEETTQSISNALSEVYENKVSIKSIKQRQAGDVSLSLADIRYLVGEDNQLVKETVIFLDARDLDLPKFEMRPLTKGILGSITVGLLGDGLGLKFDDTPVFSKKYMVHSWVEPATRILFTRQLRKHFSGTSGWRVRGTGTFLVTCNQQVKGPEFVSKSLEILNLFRAGEEELDSHPSVERVVSAESMLAQTGQMGAIGSLVAGQIREVAVSADELTRFKTAASPRQIPAGMKTQVLGANFMIMWIVFLLSGIASLVFALFVPETVPKLVLLFAGGVFGGIGGIVGLITFRNRRNKSQALRDGVLVPGKVVGIKSTSMKINYTTIFHVDVAYQKDGVECQKTVSASGEAVTKARRFLNSKAPVDLFVGDKAVVCIDFLHLLSNGPPVSA